MKHILATTARRVDPDIAPVTVPLSDGEYVAEPPWTVNAAGRRFHNWYGFGAVDVDAAIRAARTFVAGSLGLFQQTPGSRARWACRPSPTTAGWRHVHPHRPATPVALVAEEIQIEVIGRPTRRPATWGSSSSARPGRGASS